jgi:hypothetical protein
MNSQLIATIGFGIIALILLGFAALILWKVYDNQIRLDGLLSELPGPKEAPEKAKASLSRFQFLIFTFVIAGLYLLLSIEAGTFVEIPTNVLGLLGISGGSFLISKAVSNAKEEESGGGDEKTGTDGEDKKTKGGGQEKP